MATMSVGSINERGYLKGFKRRGFTDAKCLLELVANSLDSIDRRGSATGIIRFDIGTDIRMSDRNSEGMDRTAIANMFDMHRENHASDTSRGVSGIGAKPALSNLSRDRNMHLLTYKAGGEHLHVSVPWADIHREGRYTGMVTVRAMTAEEMAAFGPESGTTIVFPYSDELCDLIRHNFEPCKEDSFVSAPLDRIGVVFGRERVRIEYKHHEEPAVRVLPLYNYFDGSDADFYKGKTEHIIEHWCSGDKDRFICEGKEIQVAGGGFSKIPTDVRTNMQGFVQTGDYTVVVGLRRDPAIFDPATPVLPTADSKHHNAYNTEHLGEQMREFLPHSKLVRNGQTIGLVPLVDTNAASARASGLSHLTIQLLQCEVRFNPVSAQDNRQDKVMGIQENKNQYSGEGLPVTFTRLVKALRSQKAAEIWDYFVAVTDAAAPPPPLPPSEPSSDSDSDSDSESDSEPLPPPLPLPTPPSEPLPLPTPPSEPAPLPLPVPEPPSEPAGLVFQARLQQLAAKCTASMIVSEDLIAHLAALEDHLP